jgi:hypothetical protein
MTGYNLLMVIALLFSLQANLVRRINLQKILVLRLLPQDDELVTLQL